MIVSGSPNALLLAQAGDPLDEFGKIERSLRFRRSATPSLSRTPTANGNRTTWTFSVWVRLGGIVGANVFGIFVNHGDGGTYRDFIEFQNDQLRFDINSTASSFAGQLRTNAVYRDLASHMHIVAVFDSANPTAAERMRLFVNGARVTSFSAQTFPPQNAASWTNGSGIIHRVGVDPFAGSIQSLDGNLSNVVFVDGQALDPTAFGRFNPRTGQWRPKSKSAIKAVADAGGVNSSYLTFDDPTSITTLCADASVKGNNWTANNISLTAGSSYDSMLDTPTNNFCVMTQLSCPGQATISDGGLRSDTTHTTYGGPNGTIGVTAGKWYWEVTSGSGNGVGCIGVRNELSSTSFYPGSDANGFGYAQDGRKFNGAAFAYGAAWTTGDVIGVAFDADAGSITFYKNGVSQGVAFTGISRSRYLFPAHGDVAGAAVSADDACFFNFGQRPFAYTPPAGFKVLCTKNLPYPRIPNPQSAYVAVKQSGANVVAALSELSAWPAWIRLYKRLDGVEGWRWQFSDDSANYMDSASTAAKAAFPALTGASYVAHALKVSATNGIATGRLNHASGVVDAVVDGLDTKRKIIILRNEATGTWRFYHPDLTAGKLIYIESPTTSETTDPTINTVTASGFTVDASLATGTYRWIALGEVAGFSSVGSYVTTGSADGPYVPMQGSPGFFFARLKAAGDLPLLDTTRSPNNVANSVLYLSATDAEASASSINSADFVSTGIKLRSATSTPEDLNYTSGLGVVFFSILSAPFRYANAR